jgi:hypothetical protein
MANQWVEAPGHLPRKCALTGNSSPEAGPYLETDLRYFDPDPNAAARGELRLNTLYLSKQWLEFALGIDGSPFAHIDNAQYARLLAEIKEKDAQIATLSDRVAELEAGAPVTVDRDSLRLVIDGMERTTPPASSAPSSTDPDHHEAQAPKRRTRQKVAS